MRRRRIDIGNAREVIERGRNVTIVPVESDSTLQNSESVRSRPIRYTGLDVANGSPPQNPDGIDVDDLTFPGWRVEAYNCASGVCASMPASQAYVEVTDNLGPDWDDAYLILTIEHIGTSTEMLFQVTSATLEPVVPVSTPPVNLTYAYSGGAIVNPTGVYAWHLATTDADGKKVMLMEMREPGDYALLPDSTYVKTAARSRGEAYVVYVDGAFRPEDHYVPLIPSSASPGFYYSYTIEAV